MPQSSGRADHFSPRAYLRGFIHPNRADDEKPLWVQDVPSPHWQLRSPKQFGYVYGLYDYSGPEHANGSAEDAFCRPENDLPSSRDRIRTDGYESWVAHRPTLIRFAAMLSARTPMFLGQVKESIGGLPNADAAQDHAIDAMRSEIAERADRWSRLHWALRYTYDPDNSVITGDHCVGVDGVAPTLKEASYDPRSTVFFPVSRDMCLFGAVAPITPITALFRNEDLELLRTHVYRHATSFVVATVPLLFPGA
jgi:hypothetical protein